MRFFFQKLSRKELRPLRRNLSSRRELKRCGKRIQLHCDPDENQFIFESEWLTCVLKQQEGITILYYYRDYRLIFGSNAFLEGKINFKTFEKIRLVPNLLDIILEFKNPFYILEVQKLNIIKCTIVLNM